MHPHKILNLPRPDIPRQNTLSQELGVSRILAQILINRGLDSPDKADKFLNAGLDCLGSPYAFLDMPKAVGLVRNAVSRQQKAMLFGDYDVDGITSLVLLKNTLSKIGLKSEHYLPHRIKEGYGLAKNILKIAREKNIGLLITADCGISNVEEISQLRRANIAVIVTDHHEPTDQKLPPASAIINPKVKNSGYKYKDLAGVGVAYKFCQAIAENLLAEELDLVCLGTIADIVPLVDENRVIARQGLALMPQTKRVGLRALIEISGIKNKKIGSTYVSFILSPRINACGRMDTAETALNLLLSRDKQEAEGLARQLDGYNRQRQKIENRIMEEAEALIEKEVNFKQHQVMVIAGESWHQGVLGIVAAKLTERFYRPTVIISLKDGICKGSARSIKNFHLFKALMECRDFLDSFGGHSYAAGLSIQRQKISGFRKRINRLAKDKLRLEDLLPSLDIDLELSLGDLSQQVIAELERLEPFGAGNPEPLFYSRGLKLKADPLLLGRDTLKFWVTDNKFTYQAIGFGMGAYRDSLLEAETFDLVYTLKIDNWQDKENILLEAEEIFFHGIGKYTPAEHK